MSNDTLCLFLASDEGLLHMTWLCSSNSVIRITTARYDEWQQNIMKFSNNKNGVCMCVWLMPFAYALFCRKVSESQDLLEQNFLVSNTTLLLCLIVYIWHRFWGSIRATEAACIAYNTRGAEVASSHFVAQAAMGFSHVCWHQPRIRCPVHGTKPVWDDCMACRQCIFKVLCPYTSLSM